jgi:hypothetical protein
LIEERKRRGDDRSEEEGEYKQKNRRGREEEWKIGGGEYSI